MTRFTFIEKLKFWWIFYDHKEKRLWRTDNGYVWRRLEDASLDVLDAEIERLLFEHCEEIDKDTLLK